MAPWPFLSLVLAVSAPDPHRSVALFMLTKNDPSPTTVEALVGEFEALAKGCPEVKLVRGPELARLLATDPEQAIAACGADLSCIAELGRKAKAGTVLYGRVSPAASGPSAVQVQFLALSVATASIERKLGVALDSADAVASALTSPAFQLLGYEGAGRLEITGLDGEVTIDGSPAGTAPGWFEVRPGRHQVAVADMRDQVVVVPGRPKTLHIVRLGTALTPAVGEPGRTSAPTRDAAELTARAGSLSESLPGAALQWWKTPLLMRYAGLSLAGAGALSLIGGILFGAQSRSLYGSITHGPNGTSQLEALDTRSRAAMAARNANTFFVIGAVALTSGGVLVLTDWLRGRTPRRD